MRGQELEGLRFSEPAPRAPVLHMATELCRREFPRKPPWCSNALLPITVADVTVPPEETFMPAPPKSSDPPNGPRGLTTSKAPLEMIVPLAVPPRMAREPPLGSCPRP
jgi:hypothetical protein